MSVWMTYVNRRKTSTARIQLKYPSVGGQGESGINLLRFLIGIGILQHLRLSVIISQKWIRVRGSQSLGGSFGQRSRTRIIEDLSASVEDRAPVSLCFILWRVLQNVSQSVGLQLHHDDCILSVLIDDMQKTMILSLVSRCCGGDLKNRSTTLKIKLSAKVNLKIKIFPPPLFTPSYNPSTAAAFPAGLW